MKLDKIKNYSLIDDWQVYQWFDQRFYKDFLLEAIVLPDVCPAGLIPNGTCVITRDSWLDSYQFREVISDIGCSMSIARITECDIENLRNLWNQLYEILIKLNKTVLGSGNHFIDACLGTNNELFIIVHVGSRMSSEEKSKFKFKRDYNHYLKRARENHDEIWDKIKTIFKDFQQWEIHCHDSICYEEGDFVIRKGANVTLPGGKVLIASSFNDTIILGTAKDTVAKLKNSMSHGTGRNVSRSDAKKVSIDSEHLRNCIIIPDQLNDIQWRLEAPQHYRTINEVIHIFEKYITIENKLTPVAFMGGF